MCARRGFADQLQYKRQHYYRYIIQALKEMKGSTLTWSCCSWTPDRGTLHGWGIENKGYWHCRRFLGAKAGRQRRAWPCWGSGLRSERERDAADVYRYGCGLRRSRCRSLTFVLAVQRVDPPQPHQSHEQQNGPHDLHEETTLPRRHSSTLTPQDSPMFTLITFFNTSWELSVILVEVRAHWELCDSVWNLTLCLLRMVQFFHSRSRTCCADPMASSFDPHRGEHQPVNLHPAAHYT